VYQVEITLPDKDPHGLGLRAFDGVPLEKGPVPLTWSFRTSRVTRQGSPAAPPPSCDDAVHLLARGGCAHCHTGSSDSPYGLALDSTRGLADTAIGRPAHETSTWAIPGTTLDEPPRFGTGMSLIDAASPATSYLFYKLLENPGNFGPDGTCTTIYSVALPPGQCLVASPAERARLADWFVAGDPMPPGHAALPGGASDLRALASFIESSTSGCQ
jgi:hypothetical protein